MTEQARAFGYLCPRCGKRVMDIRDAFALSASGVSISCGCGASALYGDYDGFRYRFRVPCGLCGQTHEALCPPERVLRGAAAFSCPRSGQFVCFIGPPETVERHLRNLEAEKEADGEKRDGTDGGAFVNEVIMYEVLSELKEIAARPDGISCRCGSRRYQMKIRRFAVDLVCGDCGARLRLPAVTAQDLEDLCCHVRLEIPGKSSGESMEKEGTRGQ